MPQINSTRPVRVLLVSPLPPPSGGSGGIGRWTVLLLDWFSTRADVKLELVDISVQWRSMWDLRLWKRIVGGIMQGLRNAAQFLVKLVFFRPEVIHLNTSAQLRGPWDTAMLALAKIAGARSFYHLRMGRLPEIMANGSWEWWGLRWALKLADWVVVLDKRSEGALKRYLPPERVLLLPNAIAAPRGDGTVVPAEKKTVLYAGHVEAAKGPRELLEAWRDLCPPGWCLRLAGLGSVDYQNELLKIVGSDADVKFLGELNQKDVLACMEAADIFVLPTYTEGFPNVILEAMAARKPIVSTRVGAIPEMLEADSKEPCGLVIEPRDTKALTAALFELLSDSQLRETLGRRALARVNQCYTTNIVFGRLLILWKGAAGRPVGTASRTTTAVAR